MQQLLKRSEYKIHANNRLQTLLFMNVTSHKKRSINPYSYLRLFSASVF